MKLGAALLWPVLILHSLSALSQTSRIYEVEAMTNDQVWDALVNIDSNGFTLFGKCRVAEATTCAGCACTHFFRAGQEGSFGYQGWPKNPLMGDGTGCLTGCWNGFSPAMCSDNQRANAKAMLLDALNKNVCGSSPSPQTSGGLTVRDSSRFLFVDPSASCSRGKILCGVTGLAGDVGSLTQFTRMPDKICRTSLTTAKKMKASKIQYLTCEEFGLKNANNELIQKAASMVGQLNQTYTLFAMVGLQKFMDSNEDQYLALSTHETALFYVAVQKDVSKLPSNIRYRINPAKFTVFRAPGEDFIIQEEINDAESRIQLMSKDLMLGNGFDVSGALEFLKKK